MQQWSNWSGSVVATPARDVTVAGEDQLSDLIRSSEAPLRPVGAGHSFTPVAAVEGGTLLRLAGFDEVVVLPDDAAGQKRVRIGAGQTLGHLTSELHPLGQALKNMGDIDDQTVAGALGTATHGTGLQFGCYPSMLQALTLIDGTGCKQVLSRERDVDLFRAMAVGIGTGGVLTEAVINTVAPYRLDRMRYTMPIHDLLAEFDSRMSAARNVEFYYITGSGLALITESRETNADLIARPADKDQEGLAQLRLTSRLTQFSPALRRMALGMAIKSHAKEHFIEDWHLAFPTDREGIRFNEAEYHLPIEVGPEAIRRVIDVVERDFRNVYFPLEVRTVKADDLMLSPFQGRDSVSIAVHHEAGKPFKALLAAVERIFAEYDGRPHWGKMHSLKAADLRRLYPDFDLAVEARRHLDPKGLFLTPYMQALLAQ